MKKIIYVILFLIPIFIAHPDEMNVGSEDILLEEEADGGFHLWIRKNDSVKSVMITESTADPDKKKAVFSLRAREYNSVNGGEKRILDGKFIPEEKKLYFLIDSTPEMKQDFGEAFHIFIPYVTEYGYPWSRNGEIYLSAGTFINIRTFEKQYCDYTGRFMDNPFLIDIIQVPLKVIPPDNYMEEAVDSFREIAEKGNGEIIYSEGEESLLDDIAAVLDHAEGESLDLVFAIDTTESMKNDVPFLKEKLIELLEEKTEGFIDVSVGLVYYKDYGETYITKTVPFTRDMEQVKKAVDRIKVWGGKDRPEAVYEALDSAVTGYAWSADERIIILIGDAPPHPKPKGSIRREDVFKKASEREIKIYPIILPQ